MSTDIAQYVFYVGLLAIAGVGEYLHLLPPATLVGVLGLVTGHFFGNGATKAVLQGISTNVSTMTDSMVHTASLAQGVREEAVQQAAIQSAQQQEKAPNA